MRVKDEEAGLVTDEEERRGLVTEQDKPREVGVRYGVVESRRYGTLSL